MPDERQVLIIAGPNGAGKTTFAREFLPNEASCPVFVNADLIAAGLAPFAPHTASVQAGRLMLVELQRHFDNRESFAFETTLAGKAYLRHITAWRAATIFPKRSSVDALPSDWIISGCTTPQLSMPGRFTTTRANCRDCWTGTTTHDKHQTHSPSQQPDIARLLASPVAGCAACSCAADPDRHGPGDLQERRHRAHPP